MKKKLEADLISIAHRILQLKNKSDVNQLYIETQKLYEKLAVLRFVNEHYGDAQPTIGYQKMEEEIQKFYDKDAHLPVDTVIEMTESNLPQDNDAEKAIFETAATVENPLPVTEDELIDEHATKKTDDIQDTETSVSEESVKDENENIAFEADIKEEPVDAVNTVKEAVFEEEILGVQQIDEAATSLEEKDPELKTAFEVSNEAIEKQQKNEAVQISFEDLLGGNYNDTQFVRVENVPALPSETVFEVPQTEKTVETIVEKKDEEETHHELPPVIKIPAVPKTPKSVSLNDTFSKGIDIDLNDRIAFVKHLFGNSEEDYNRVLNQLITFDTFYETRNFIQEMVKPDYNNWKGKDDYAERFMDIIEKKFL
jgi:hypothetical protein